jgi:hypothetical protein
VLGRRDARGKLDGLVRYRRLDGTPVAESRRVDGNARRVSSANLCSLVQVQLDGQDLGARARDAWRARFG